MITVFHYEGTNTVSQPARSVGDQVYGGAADRALRFFAEELDGLVILAGAALVALGSIFGALKSLEQPALVAVSVGLGVRVLRMRYQVSDLARTLDAKTDSVRDTVAEEAALVRSDVLALEGRLLSQGVHEAEMCDRSSFYRHMLSALGDAKKSVDLTQLDSQPPKHYGTPEMVEYFDLQTKMVREVPTLKFRRIVAVPTLEKLEWVLDILDKVNDCANFQINVIDLSRASELPPPLSLQIFDRKELCLVDPTLGFMLPEDQRHMLWIRGTAACEVFSVYYDSIWALSQRVKEGNIVYWEVLEGVAKELAARFPEKRTLSRVLLQRIRSRSSP